MPHRLVCVGILILWAVSAGMLLSRDVLPDLLIGAPPDMRSVTTARTRNHATRWAIQLAGRESKVGPSSIGQASTQAALQQDGCVKLSSRIWFDSENLLMGTPLNDDANRTKIEILSTYEINPTGDLSLFRASVHPMGTKDEWIVVSGALNSKRDGLLVHATGLLPILNWSRTFPYSRHGMVQNSLDPFDRMPGLQIGQRWRSQVVSPITGQFQSVSVEVTRKQILDWNGGQIEATEVVTRMEPFSMRTWVRADGLVVRQQVPFPRANLILERLPDAEESPLEKKPQ